MMRRRDLDIERENDGGAFNMEQFQEQMDQLEEEENSSLFMEGMFGGLVSIPLPVPEIISSLDSSKFKYKQAQFKKKGQNLNESSSGSGLWRQCPICWSDFQRNDFVTTLHCNEQHVFHTECIEQWIRKGQNSCPLCRKQIANL